MKTETATLTIFKEKFVKQLQDDVRINLPQYQEPEIWVLQGDAKKRDLPSTLAPKVPLVLAEPDGKDLKDAENAVRIHKALGHLTRLQARDPRLWTRLAHVELWPYMRCRWEAERHSGDKAIRYVLSHYFVAQNQSRALVRHGIARLWWSAYLSYDPSRSNPYQLTEVLFSLLDINRNLLERNMGRSAVITTTFLDFLLRHKDPLLTGGDLNRKRIRRLSAFLNRHGGFCILDTLSPDDLLRLLERELFLLLKREDAAAATV